MIGLLEIYEEDFVEKTGGRGPGQVEGHDSWPTTKKRNRKEKKKKRKEKQTNKLQGERGRGGDPESPTN